MQLVIEIQNNSLANKVIKILDVFKSDGLKIIKRDNPEDPVIYSDEYVEANWKSMLSEALSDTDADGDNWKLEYGEYLAKKHQ